MASDDSLLPWDDQEILYFAEKLYAVKLFIFFMGLARKHKQKPNRKSSLSPGSAVGRRQKTGWGRGKGWQAWRQSCLWQCAIPSLCSDWSNVSMLTDSQCCWWIKYHALSIMLTDSQCCWHMKYHALLIWERIEFLNTDFEQAIQISTTTVWREHLL